MSLLAIIVFAAIVTALGLVAAYLCPPRSSSRALSAGEVQQACTRLDAYRPLRRVISDEDCRFLIERMNRADLAEKLRTERQRILRLYLMRMRSDFLVAWSLCRTLAVVSDNPDFAFDLVRQYSLFQVRYATVRLELAFGVKDVWGSPQSVVDCVERLHDTTGLLLQPPKPAAAGALG